MAKEAEKRVVAFAKHFDWYRHKYGDVRRCIHCHEILPKTENAPDYAIAPIYTWIEAKNSTKSTERWNWDEIGPSGARRNQRAWLIKNGGWLFIELSNKDARGPEGRGAYLVPFKSWLAEVEPILLKAGQKSIGLTTKRNLGADSLLAKWSLEWVANVGWLPGPNHVWWESLTNVLNKELRSIETYQKEGICPTP